MSDTKHPLVSVLVPIYNVERYLERCLSSLAAQTFNDFEVICVNDGSTDASPNIVRGFADRDKRFILVNKENSGYGASMNVGLDRARGRYVAILESDDFFDPQALELLVYAAEAANAEVAKGNFWLYWSKPAEKRVPFSVVDGPMVGRTFCPRGDADIAVFFRKSSSTDATSWRRTASASWRRRVPRTRTWASTSRYGPRPTARPSSPTACCATVRTMRRRPSSRAPRRTACATSTRPWPST